VSAAAVVILGGILVALLAPPASPANSYLDPASTRAAGSHALAVILAERGTQVSRVTTAAAALAASRRDGAAIMVTSPDLLSDQDLARLAAARADLFIADPTGPALAALAPAVTVAGIVPAGPRAPGCALSAATAAGDADLGGITLRVQPGIVAARCYPAAGLPTLVRYAFVSAGARPRERTILGTGTALQNSYLGRRGNAALALNLLGRHRRIAWLVPQQQDFGGVAAGSRRSIWSLLPRGTYLVAAQLGVALLVTALWRARRLGPLVPERLPVVVRAAETTEGHARLYQARRARGRAAEALRQAVTARLVPALGLPAGAAAGLVAIEVSRRTTVSEARARELLAGPAPASDADLVRLADDLDAMEKEVRAP